MELTGKIKRISDTETFASGFQKREFKCKLALYLGFNYCEITGEITTPTGKKASKLSNKYILLTLRCKESGITYYLYGHHFAWYSINKECVPLIDHINKCKFDNRISNLRSTTKSINARNTEHSKGVYFDKRSNKFIAYYTINYKKKQLGIFNSYKEAREVYINHKNNFLNGITRSN